jgi:ribosomal protein S18 acetylase RimI-like enzyme
MTMTAYAIGWEEGVEAWRGAARFFARVIALDPAYISHGEIQAGLSLDGSTWIADLEARFLAEATGGKAGAGSRSLAVARDSGSGAIVGAAAVSWSFEAPDAPYAVLQDLAVEPALRSRGLGAEMAAFVEREVKARGARWLFLTSGKDNLRAHRFFERSGFHKVSHVFAKRLEK